MRPGAQIRAAVEVFEEVTKRHRPAAAALADWGKAHRFAGSGDRSAIGNLVYDALRRWRSLSAQMGSDTARAVVLAAAPRAMGLSADEVAAGADGSQHALSPLTDTEREGLARILPPDTDADIRGDYPAWLSPSMTRAFGSAAAEEGAALAARAPVDLRVNTLKADRNRLIAALGYRLQNLMLPGPVEELTLELSGLIDATSRQELLPGFHSRRPRQLAEASRQLKQRFGTSGLYRVAEVEPWSRLPERRQALIAYDP